MTHTSVGHLALYGLLMSAKHCMGSLATISQDLRYIGDMTMVACTVRQTLLALPRGHAGSCDRGVRMWMRCERFIEESPARYGFRNCTALRGVAEVILNGQRREVSERSARGQR